MSKLVAVMGESGSGKTTSLEGLDPATTFVVDADKKGLPWRRADAEYNRDAANYIVTDETDAALKTLRAVDGNPKYAHIKTFVVDTVNGLMVADEARRINEKGYDKWQDMAWSIWGLVDYALTARDDLVVVFLCHSQTERDDSGYLFTRIRTSGKKLDKIVLESKFNCVLLAKREAGDFVFELSGPTSTAKVPRGAFSSRTVPNDMSSVLATLRDYWGLAPVASRAEAGKTNKDKE